VPADERIRWAKRLRPALLERLYRADARGLRDEELCEEVGSLLFARCETFRLVAASEVECPACHAEFRVATRGTTACPSDGCGWSTDAKRYAESVRRHYAHTGRALDAYDRFRLAWPRARRYGERIVLIDQLVHAFHLDEKTGRPVKSVASKLFEGNKKTVVRFLDALSARDAREKQAWRKAVAATIDAGQIARED